MLYSTGIAPLITDLMIRYPHGEVVGFTWTGILLALGVGLVIGFFLPAGMAHSPKVHKGYDLYSAAVPVGMTAFFLQAILYKTMGLRLRRLRLRRRCRWRPGASPTYSVLWYSDYALCLPC